MRIVAIDVGITHLGVASVDADDAHGATVADFALVDITIQRHVRVSRRACTLQHGNTLCDRLAHFVQEHRETFDAADAVVIEQQPPFGHQAVEQLLFSRFRSKAHLASPVAMHAHFGWTRAGLDYEARKRAVEQRVLGATRLLSDEQRERLHRMPRQHDVCDAVCMALFWNAQRLRRAPTPARVALADGETFDFDDFCFKGSRARAARKR